MKFEIAAYNTECKEPKLPILNGTGNQNIKIKKAKGKIEIIDILKNLD
tara:strand:+ start:442 stop:585 length:144 start_codon:yes stop_codon:yes gene_type:complete